jgi:hypothetical protein
MNLPDAYTNPFPAGNDFYWWRQGPPDPNQGHMFGAAGYVAGSKWMRCDTWGMTGFISLPAISYYCADAQGGAIYAALSQDWLAAATKLAPNGYNWTQLEADLAAI